MFRVYILGKISDIFVNNIDHIKPSRLFGQDPVDTLYLATSPEIVDTDEQGMMSAGNTAYLSRSTAGAE